MLFAAKSKPYPRKPESGLVARMDRDNAPGKIPVAGACEARRFHHRLQFFLRRMLPDRFGQVLVTVRVAGEQEP